jgi:hypothetical protein
LLVVKNYHSSLKTDWDQFIKNSKNGTFLFYRDFMEYHQDRFQDFSLMVYEKEKLLAVLPANRLGAEVFSHQGLTYGGFVFSKKIKFEKILEVVQAVLQYLNEKNIHQLQLKVVPRIYQTYPSDEIDYLLFLLKAKKIRCDISSTIKIENALRIQSNRMEGVKKAQKNALTIKKENEFEIFWKKILTPNLNKKYGAKPVHTDKEIKLLSEFFPKNIQQYNVYKDDEIVGGATIFETENVAHVQYISANHKKQELGTLDFLFHHLITEKFKHKKYFDFGVSNEQAGLKVNKGLLYWKECFGARSVVHDFYEVETKNYTLLNTIFNR